MKSNNPTSFKSRQSLNRIFESLSPTQAKLVNTLAWGEKPNTAPRKSTVDSLIKLNIIYKDSSDKDSLNMPVWVSMNWKIWLSKQTKSGE